MLHCCAKGGEPDLKTAAKMVLHDWVRGRIPFFIPPPRIEGPQLEEVKKATPAAATGPETTAEGQPETEEQKASQIAADAIAEVVKKQRVRKVPVKENFFDVEDIAHPDGAGSESESEADDDMDDMGSGDDEAVERAGELLSQSGAIVFMSRCSTSLAASSLSSCSEILVG